MRVGPDALGAGAINRALERAPWARDKLLAHATKSFGVTLGPLTSAFRIDGDGHVEPLSLAEGTADLHLTFSPLSLPSLLADPARWSELVAEQGDAALAATMRELATTLPWLVEDAFARLFGDVAGQRMADAGRRLLALPGYAAERVADSVTSYARDEADLLARGDEMRVFAEQNGALASRVEALAARIDALTLALPGESR